MSALRVAAAALLAAVVAAGSGKVSAGTYEHARATGSRCSTCHDSKRPHLANLNARGQYFLRHRTLDGYTPPTPSEPRGGREREPGKRPSNALATGLAVYTRSCVVCHGPQGRGTPLAATLAGPRKHATTEAAAVAVITNGIKGTAMAPFGTALTGQEIRAVARYVMTLRPAAAPK